MQSSSPNAARCDPESGFLLLTVIFLSVVLLISLAIAAPKIAMSIQREKEIETIHRGEQYKRAIQLYYRKFGSYPTSIDQLVQTNQIRFLRKRYKDPMTGKDDWKPVYFGQAHVRPLGFFGQPLSGIAGIGAASVAMGGMSGSMYAASTTTTDANGVPVASPDGSTTGSSSSPASTTGTGFGGTSSTGPSFGGMTGSQMGGSSFGSAGSTGSSFGATSGSAFGSSSGAGFGSSTGTGFGSSSGTGFGSSSGTSAGSFGGTGPIVGFTLPVDKPSLIDYKKQTRYNHWEFNYDPMEEQMQAAASLMGGAGNINNTSSATSGNSFGGSSSSSSFGGSSGSSFGGSSFGSSSGSSFGSSTGSGTTGGSTTPGSVPPNPFGSSSSSSSSPQ